MYTFKWTVDFNNVNIAVDFVIVAQMCYSWTVFNICYMVNESINTCAHFQKGDPCPAKEEVPLPGGWKWDDEWQVDLNRAVDEEGKTSLQQWGGRDPLA